MKKINQTSLAIYRDMIKNYKAKSDINKQVSSSPKYKQNQNKKKVTCWTLDSEATYHITNNINGLKDIIKSKEYIQFCKW